MAPPHEPHGRAVSGSERLYRALLAAYPKEFRRAHGREMAQVFRCMCREEVVSGGRGGLARLWVRMLLDLLATALAERIKQALQRRSKALTRMHSWIRLPAITF